MHNSAVVNTFNFAIFLFLTWGKGNVYPMTEYWFHVHTCTANTYHQQPWSSGNWVHHWYTPVCLIWCQDEAQSDHTEAPLQIRSIDTNFATTFVHKQFIC